MGAEHIPSTESPARPRRPAQVIALNTYRQRVAETVRDGVLEAAWNRLAALVAEALCWRDPESLAAVEACVAHLKVLVLADWGEKA